MCAAKPDQLTGRHSAGTIGFQLDRVKSPTILRKLSFSLPRGGIVAQWLQMYLLDWDTYLMVLATFADEFPHVLVFQMGPYDTLLLGSEEPIHFDVEEMDRLVAEKPAIRRDLVSHCSAADGLAVLRRNQVLNTAEVRALVANVSRRNTDTHLRLQYDAALSLGSDSSDQIRSRLLGAQRDLRLPLVNPPSERRRRQPGYLAALVEKSKICSKSSRFSLAEQLLRECLSLGAETHQVHMLLGYALTKSGRDADAEFHFTAAGHLDPHASIDRARKFMAHSEFSMALQLLRAALKELPTSAAVHRELGRAHDALGHIDEAKANFRRAFALDPGDVESRSALQRLDAARS